MTTDCDDVISIRAGFIAATRMPAIRLSPEFVLHAAFEETLRLFGPVAALVRRTARDVIGPAIGSERVSAMRRRCSVEPGREGDLVTIVTNDGAGSSQAVPRPVPSPRGTVKDGFPVCGRNPLHLLAINVCPAAARVHEHSALSLL